MKNIQFFNIRVGLACNSSSSHSILFLGDKNNDVKTDEYSDFGWNYFTAADKESKNNYLYSIINQAFYKLVPPSDKEAFYGKFFDNMSDIDTSASVDHQSVVVLPSHLDGTINTQFIEDFQKFLLQDNVVITGGNDNDNDFHPIKGTEKSNLDKLPTDGDSSQWLARKDKKYDFWTLFNRSSGSKVRFSFNDLIQAPTKASSPELVDIKITDFCPFACDFCYQDSTLQGQHASMDNIKYIVQELKKAEVFEVACLAEGTMVLTKTGYKNIESLVIGDEVFSSDGTLKKIKNIIPSEKECINLIGNKGFEVTCTPDHPFICNGEVVEAQYLLGKYLDQLDKKIVDSPTLLNISQFIIERSEHPNSRSGSINGNMHKYCSRSIYVPNEISLSKELMFLYGIVVAEGSKKGITLHANETDIAQRVGKFYSSLSEGLNYSIYKKDSSPNGMSVEFSTPSFYESIFFKAMNCGYGAHNKNLSFLYSLNDKELIREALYGLFVGDGCFRTKKNGKYTDFSLSFKTVSKTLAMDLIALMKIHFDINGSFYEGISPDRELEGRILKSSTYFKIDVYGKSNIDKIFPFLFENNEEYKKIGTDLKKTHIKIKSIVPAGIKKVFDITLEDESTHIFALSHGVLTHNCGGGETTLHPNFTEIVKLFKDNGIVFNFTTRNYNLFKHKDAKTILDNCGAIAFSIGSSDDLKKIEAACMESIHPKAQLHDYQSSINLQYVMGTTDLQEFKKILLESSYKNLNVTLLGYKTVGRGDSFIPDNYDGWIEIVRDVKEQLKKENKYLYASIDTALAAQYKDELVEMGVNIKTFHTTEGNFSLYIDAVNKTMGPSSYSGDYQKTSFDDNWLTKYENIGMEAPKEKPKKSIKIKK